MIARRDGSTFNLFFDGQIVATATGNAAVEANSKPLLIGRRDYLDPREMNFPMNGREDEVAIWTRALSDPEVTALYNGGQGMALNIVPEPASVIMLGIGVFGLVCFGWSRRPQ